MPTIDSTNTAPVSSEPTQSDQRLAASPKRANYAVQSSCSYMNYFTIFLLSKAPAQESGRKNTNDTDIKYNDCDIKLIKMAKIMHIFTANYFHES